jgi:hypothetical protein
MLEKTAKKQENNLPKFSLRCSRCKTINLVDNASFRKCDSKLGKLTKPLRRVFDPIDERWIFVDEPYRVCLSNHENIKIIKNEGGEKE